MSEHIIATAHINVNAQPADVWDALVNPVKIKQYFFGVDVRTDWQEGSDIIYAGEWEGKKFEDKGKILKIEPEKILLTNYWSGMSGKPDSPENYQKVAYELKPETDGTTTVTIAQDNIKSEEEKQRCEGHWHIVLKGLKDLVEKG